MSVEMFLKLDGVTGGSKNYIHKGWADVASWAWTMGSNRNLPQVNGDDETSFREISVVKRIGSDSTEIMSLYAQGKTIPSAELDIVPIVAKREAKQKYLSIRMEDVLIKSIVTGGNSSEEFFNENLVLLFGKVRFEYSFNASPGTETAGGPAVDYKFGWDIPQNKEW